MFFLHLILLGLNNFLTNYDNVRYDRSSLNRRTSRVQRSIDKYVYLNFKSLGREFKLKLKPVTDLNNFCIVDKSNFKLELNNSSINLDDLNLNANLYAGILLDEPLDSLVSGLILDGLFYGTIKSKKKGNYFIQSSSKLTNTDSNLIIYHENDVNLNVFNHQNDTSSLGCGSANAQIDKWLKNEQNRMFKERGFDPFSYIDINENQYEEKKKYTKDWNRFDGVLNDQFKLNIKKRDLTNNQPEEENKAVKLNFPDKRTVCNLYLKVDYVLYNEIFKNEGNQVIFNMKSFS